MTSQTVLYEAAGGVAKITLNRPDKLNSFNEEMHHAFAAALDAAAGPEVRAVLLTGAGRGFCAGQDLDDRNVAPGAEAPDLGYSLETFYNPHIRKIAALRAPVVCAVNGAAAGAGANIALACDIVLASKAAKFIQPFCKLGLVPDSSGTYSLPRLVGPARAMGLSMLGEALTGDVAEVWGLIWKSYEPDALMAEAEKLAAHLATQPTKGLALIKRALRASPSNTLDQQLDLERDLQREAGRSNDYREGVAAFIEKRAPTFTGS